jgi:hypothetical protein
MPSKFTTTTLPQGERHSSTQAAKTTTQETATARPRTVAQVLAEQQQATPAEPQPALPAHTEAKTPVAPRSQEALERNLAAIGSVPLTSIVFDGNEGIYKADGNELPDGALFIAVIPETRRGFIRFHGAGVQPDVEMTCISEDRPELTRDDLPEGYEQRPGMDGNLQDAWQPQTVIPLIDAGEAAEMFSFVARNKGSLSAADHLLRRYLFHPKRKEGLYPIIKLKSGSYHSKKFNRMIPKPILQICGSVDRAGGVTSTSPRAAAEFNDAIPYGELRRQGRGVTGTQFRP